MAVLLGLLLGCGLFLLWWSLWSPPVQRPQSPSTNPSSTQTVTATDDAGPARAQGDERRRPA